MPFLVLFLIAALTAVDQFIKMLVITNLKPIETVAFIPGFLNFTYVENIGAAFGMLSGLGWVLITLTSLTILVLLVFIFRYKHHSFLSYTSCIMIIAGGIGNLIDRIAFGYVVDYIHVQFFPYVFNFADCCVVIGAILFAIWYLFIMEKKEKGEVPKQEDDGSAEA